jgi:hypothetical protein
MPGSLVVALRPSVTFNGLRDGIFTELLPLGTCWCHDAEPGDDQGLKGVGPPSPRL